MDWTLFKTFDNRADAELLAARLQNDEVPTRIDYGALECGVDGISVYVASQLVHRARWVEAGAPISEEELRFLATGQLRDDDDPAGA
jgi:hypothetical protein